jgi:hypothetical protein
LGNLDQSHFLRLFSGRDGFASPIIYWNDGDPLLFGTNFNVFTEKVRISSEGYVGISQFSPTSRLHVGGGDFNIPGGASGDFRIGNGSYGFRLGVATGGGTAGDVRMFSVGGSNRLIMGTGVTDRMVIEGTGKVGIGTMTPVNRLDVRNDGILDMPTIVLGLVSDISNRPILQFSEWDSAIPNSGMAIEYNGVSAVDNKMHILGTDGQRKMTFTTSGRIGIATENPNEYLEIGDSGRMFIGDGGGVNRKGLLIDAVEPGNYVRLHAYNYSTGLDMPMFFPGSVNIGINTGATGYKLSVDGKIIAEEVRIQLSGEWPDYVFDEKYRLADLGELEQSILIHKHLPGIPSADEIRKNGLLVGDMQARLLEKIEELTLYLIRQDKEITSLKLEINSLKNNKQAE